MRGWWKHVQQLHHTCKDHLVTCLEVLQASVIGVEGAKHDTWDAVLHAPISKHDLG